ncbi:MAG: flagellar export chaperone FlgN [Bacillota bacterium]
MEAQWVELQDYVDRLEQFASQVRSLAQEKRQALTNADTAALEEIMIREEKLLPLGLHLKDVPPLVVEKGLTGACAEAPLEIREQVTAACNRIGLYLGEAREINRRNMMFLKKALEYVGFMIKCSTTGPSYQPPAR